ncbi:hypothetical protein HWB76_gp023 [Streptomyces phage Blueeyedbeauty]|uniref:Uncharacterized protein n=1 Tax=Streptomyces phage Blueeyedbeauty TaxID=2250336 RepID=A0A345L275_9CAUD|nr:hypothetical protein HWB76_gp023 [Streptomyces phage Blueeyedbeauty]AXH49377.1 hypothetical protein SEA_BLUEEYEDBEAUTY_270 [Streptomyces phage Blueeyedbeauty]
MEKCKNCGESITYAYREWWDENDDNACPKGETHFPFFRTTLAPTPVVPTMGPVAKWRKNGSGRLVPLKGKRSAPRKLVTD